MTVIAVRLFTNPPDLCELLDQLWLIAADKHGVQACAALLAVVTP